MSLPAAFTGRMADLTTHRIEGIAIHGDTPFSVALVSHIEGNLWTGGCPAPELPGFFAYVLNLYPWESYRTAPGTEVRTAKLYDHGTIPNVRLLRELADWVNEKRTIGPTLVHCQAGLNRSALVAGLALVRAGMPPADAIALMREKRSPAVLCNAAFERWLLRQDARVAP